MLLSVLIHFSRTLAVNLFQTNQPLSANELTDERQDVGGGRHVLRHQHHEDGHGQQRGDTHRHLLAAVAGDVEAEQRHQRDEDAGYDHVEDVEQGPSLDDDVARDVRVRLLRQTEELVCEACVVV